MLVSWVGRRVEPPYPSLIPDLNLVHVQIRSFSLVKISNFRVGRGLELDRLSQAYWLGAHWLMRKMTNSAGRTGQTPTSTYKRPSIIVSGVLSSPSHLT